MKIRSGYNKALRSTFILGVLGLLLLLACFSAVQAQSEEDGVKRVSVEELRAMMKKKTVVVIDVRDSETYNAEHIKGALSITGDMIAEKAKKLPRNKMIVTYCS